MGKEKKNEKQNTKTIQIAKKGRFSFHRILILLSIVGVLLVLFDITPFGGNAAFYSKWIECRRMPVKTQSLPGIIWYEETQPLEFIRGYHTYYCTPLEAEQAGYSASSEKYEFPHLYKK